MVRVAIVAATRTIAFKSGNGHQRVGQPQAYSRTDEGDTTGNHVQADSVFHGHTRATSSFISASTRNAQNLS